MKFKKPIEELLPSNMVLLIIVSLKHLKCVKLWKGRTKSL